MGDTAKRAVESTNVPQLMTALRGRVELAEGRLNNMADKSLRALEDELSSVRSEVRVDVQVPHNTNPMACMVSENVCPRSSRLRMSFINIPIVPRLLNRHLQLEVCSCTLR